MSLSEKTNEILTLLTTNDVDGIIRLLRESTKQVGPLHPNNEEELNLWNLAGWQYFLRKGKYQEAERLYRAFFETLLEQQKVVGRVHKGMPLHNLGLSLFFQGRAEEAIVFFLSAYVEDVIRGNGAVTVEQGLGKQSHSGLFRSPPKRLVVNQRINYQQS